MAATFTTLGGLVTGLLAECTELASAIEGAMNELAPFITMGTGAQKYDTLSQQVAKLRKIGVDAEDPIPGRSEE